MSTATAARIVGTAVHTSAGCDVESLWRAMMAAQPGLTERNPGDERFETPRYNAIERGADDAQAVLKRACDEVWQPLSSAFDQDTRVAMFAGSSLGGMTHLEALHRSWWTDGAPPPEDARSFALGRYDGPAAAVAQTLGMPCLPINTACSSRLTSSKHSNR